MTGPQAISRLSRIRVLIDRDDALLAAGIAATLNSGEEFEAVLRDRDFGQLQSAAEPWRLADPHKSLSPTGL